MSVPMRKAIIIVGLGRNAEPSSIPTQQVEVLAAETKKLRDVGLDSQHIDLNPRDVAQSMQRLKYIIANRDWDAFLFGFAIHSTMESTELFEKAVNLWTEMMPGRKMIFPHCPHHIAAAAIRTFGTEW